MQADRYHVENQLEVAPCASNTTLVNRAAERAMSYDNNSSSSSNSSSSNRSSTSSSSSSGSSNSNTQQVRQLLCVLISSFPHRKCRYHSAVSSWGAQALTEHRTPAPLSSAELTAMSMLCLLLYFPAKTCRTKEVNALPLLALHPLATRWSLLELTMLAAWSIRYV